MRQQRSFARQFSDYLAVLVIAPLLLATALSLTTTLESQWLVQKLIEYRVFALLYDLGLQQAPMVVLAIAFTFLYWFLPNTRVRPLAAMLGGCVAGVLVVVVQQLYLSMIVGSARYDAVFGGFAALPLLFVWIYLFWAIVLFGAEVAFAYDNLPHYRREVRGRAVVAGGARGDRPAHRARGGAGLPRPGAGVDRGRAQRSARRAGAHGARRARRSRARRRGGRAGRRREGGRLPARASRRAHPRDVRRAGLARRARDARRAPRT